MSKITDKLNKLSQGNSNETWKFNAEFRKKLSLKTKNLMFKKGAEWSKDYMSNHIKDLCEELYSDASQPNDRFFKHYSSFEDWYEKNKLF